MIGIPVRYATGDHHPSERSPIGRLISINGVGEKARAWIQTADGSFIEVRPRNMKFYSEG